MGVNWFLAPVVENGGSGSGSIIDPSGYVVTNVHVISDASKIYISLSDGTQYEGKVIGSDPESDIAVLKFTPPEGTVLKTIAFGNSDELKVGQKVIAIGNPFGLERTMTTGIVSGLGRPIQNTNRTIIRNMIQTDTAINPGNSGGPLLDTNGKMIGINTMIYSSSGIGVDPQVGAAHGVHVVHGLPDRVHEVGLHGLKAHHDAPHGGHLGGLLQVVQEPGLRLGGAFLVIHVVAGQLDDADAQVVGQQYGLLHDLHAPGPHGGVA